MNYITTTDLRTQSSKLVQSLKEGKKISLVHRSRVIGVIEPSHEEPKKFDAVKFKQFVKDLNLSRTTYAQREKKYRAYMMKKYGKDIS